MADPAEVKVGSELVFRGRVESVQPNGVLVRLATEHGPSVSRTFVSDAEVAAAEHTPPPKRFKRWDRVRWVGGKGGRGGFVTADSEAGQTFVQWPGMRTVDCVTTNDLELDEAPG